MIQFSRQFFNDPCKTSKYSLHEYCTAPICKRKSYNFHYRGKHPSKIPFLKKQPKGIVSFAAILKHITSIVSLSVPSLFFHSIILQGKMVSSSSTAMPVFGVFFYLLPARSLWWFSSNMFFRKNIHWQSIRLSLPTYLFSSLACYNDELFSTDMDFLSLRPTEAMRRAQPSTQSPSFLTAASTLDPELMSTQWLTLHWHYRVRHTGLCMCPCTHWPCSSPFLVVSSSYQKDTSIPFTSYNSFPTTPYREGAQNPWTLQDDLSPCGAFSWSGIRARFLTAPTSSAISIPNVPQSTSSHGHQALV